MTEAASGTPPAPVAAAVRHKLTEAFAPQHLEVINESSGHNVPAGSESHFKVVVVSERFAGQAPLERHRLVNTALADELAGCVPISAQERAFCRRETVCLCLAQADAQGDPRAFDHCEDARAVGEVERRLAVSTVSWRLEEITLRASGVTARHLRCRLWACGAAEAWSCTLESHAHPRLAAREASVRWRSARVSALLFQTRSASKTKATKRDSCAALWRASPGARVCPRWPTVWPM